MKRSGHDRKPPSPYEPYFEGKRYGPQLFVMKMEDKITTTKNLNSIAVNDIFSQVLKTDPAQEAPGAHEKMSFERGYKMFGDRETAVMFKQYKQMEDMEVLSGIEPDPLTVEQKQKSLRSVNLINLKGAVS